MAENKGQDTGTPTGETSTTGQEKVAASPGSETDQIIANLEAGKKADADKAKAGDEGSTDESGKKAGVEGDTKPLPYDQDPKWKAARAAQAKFESILEKHGIDADDLDALLESGSSVADILGTRDAKALTSTLTQLKKDAEYLKEVKAYWAEQKELKQKDELTPEQRAEMSESKLKAYEKEQAARKARAAEEANVRTALKGYTEQVDKMVESTGLEGEDATIAKLFLGVDNPFNEVDITDRKAVREMAKTNAAKFKTFLDGVRQKAVDEYAKGKSKIVPISKVETPAKETVSKKRGIPADVTVDNAYASKSFGDAHDEMMEILNAMQKG